VAGRERSKDLPDIQTVKELGYGNFDASSTYAVFAATGILT
jgi:tripartite-type tricarboxylate transporter receptor subunit TctC